MTNFLDGEKPRAMEPNRGMTNVERMTWFGKLKRCCNEKSDRISQLPEPVILNILSRLPLGDAAQASILSKAWKSFCDSYPILCFDHNLFALRHLLHAKEGGQEHDINQIRDLFMDDVERHLSKSTHLELPVRKLTLIVAINNSIYSRVDKLVELVRQINVEDLCIFVQNSPRNWNYVDSFTVLYHFPVSLLSSKGLRSASLRECKLTKDAFVGPVSFSTLQRLSLYQVYIDEDGFGNLARYCQRIEMLVFDTCMMFTNFLDLSQFPKLKKAAITASTGSIHYVGIVGSNLESFKYHVNCDTQCRISTASCASILDLTLKGWGCTFDQSHVFKDLTATFPLLQQAELYLYDTDTLKAVSCALRKITFRSRGLIIKVKTVHFDCPNLTLIDCTTMAMTDLYVDCPRLRTFHYMGTTVPERLFFRAGDDLEDISLNLSVNYAFNTVWLNNLRAFLVLVMANRPTELSLTFTLPMTINQHEELEVYEAPLRYNVHLKLILIPQDMPNVAELLDALLCIIRPTTLTICCIRHLPIQYLCENLIKKSQDNLCDDQETYPCWMHQLEDFQVDCSFDIPNIKQNLMVLPIKCPTANTNVSFKFQWAANCITK